MRADQKTLDMALKVHRRQMPFADVPDDAKPTVHKLITRRQADLAQHAMERARRSRLVRGPQPRFTMT